MMELQRARAESMRLVEQKADEKQADLEDMIG